jgi:hypothetical protein
MPATTSAACAAVVIGNDDRFAFCNRQRRQQVRCLDHKFSGESGALFERKPWIAHVSHGGFDGSFAAIGQPFLVRPSRSMGSAAGRLVQHLLPLLFAPRRFVGRGSDMVPLLRTAYFS